MIQQVEEKNTSEQEQNAPEAESQKHEVAEVSEHLEQFLTFTLGDEEYGLDIMKVKEIRGWSETTRLPNSPDFMKGVINLRGIVIPIFDIRIRFSMGETKPTEKHVVIVLTIGERTIGILVDTVSDILETSEKDIKPAPKMERGIDDEFLDGLISVEERMVVLLGVDKLFSADELSLADDVS